MKTKLKADGYDVAHLIVQLIDENGIDIKTQNRKVTFEIKGNARILGVDNGLTNNVQDFQSNSIVTGDGRCLLIIQSNKETDKRTIKASVEGLQTKTMEINIE